MTTLDPALDATLDIEMRDVTAQIDIGTASTLEVGPELMARVRAAAEREADPTIREDRHTIMARLSGLKSNSIKNREAQAVTDMLNAARASQETQPFAAIAQPRRGLTPAQAGFIVGFGAMVGMAVGLLSYLV